MNWIAALPKIVFAVVVLAWIVFAVVFIFGKRPAASVTPDRKRKPASIVGFVIQALAYGLVWGLPRPFLSFPSAFPNWAAVLWAAVTIAVAIGSVWLTVAAVRTLGKEWSLTARVVEEHRLVQTGPYRLVRHPIYTGMLGMLLVTGSALGQNIMIVVATVLFSVGTLIRIEFEERLLRETFGAEFDRYVRRVPALFPYRLWTESSALER